MNERSHLFDNIKGIMLFLVAFGHVIDVYCGADHNVVEYDIMKYIYLFHMPMFAFVTGYFTKNVEKARKNATKKILIPYLLFQSVYVLMAAAMIKLGLASFNADAFNYSILLPSSAFYYLLATYFWKLFAKDIVDMKYPIAISMVLGLAISLTKSTEFHIGYGAVFSLLLFFTLGLVCTSEVIEKIRKIPKVVAWIIMLLGILPAVYFPYAIHSIRFTYERQGFTNIEGLLWRIVYYVIAIIMGVAIICLTTSRKTILCKVGERSILVYAGSTFLSPSLYVLIAKFVPFLENRYINFVGMILFCVGIMYLCSMDWVNKIYTAVIDFINSVLWKKDNQEG